MLKGILLITITLACAAAGRLFSNVRKKRSEALTQILGGMRVLRIRVLNSAEPVSVLMRKSDLPMFYNLGQKIGEGMTAAEGWDSLKAGAAGELECLTAADIAVLDDFFAGLGRSGRDEQDSLFSMSVARLEEALSQAKSRYQESSKTFAALGALVGIAICIMIV